MIDFHSHILPNIDDGSSSTDESLEMLILSKKHGINYILATPHFYIKRTDIERFLEKRASAYERLVEKIGDNKDVPIIKLGAEVYFFNGIGSMDNLEKLCIENTNYMLLEMPFEMWSERILREVNNIINTKGITPIIAHIERYIPFQKDFSIIQKLIDMDVFIQMNGEFINGLLSRRRAIEFLKNDIVQLIGSDCHNMKTRKPNLDKAYSIIEKKLGKEKVLEITRFGEKILGL